MKRWQGSQGRIKRCERERLREEKVQSLIRKLKNFVSEDEEEEYILSSLIFLFVVNIAYYGYPLCPKSIYKHMYKVHQMRHN